MGEMCGKYADRIFFTTDNPDFDDPADIAGRLAHAAAQGGDARVTIQLDRTRAVERTILEAPESGDRPGREGQRRHPAGPGRIRPL